MYGEAQAPRLAILGDVVYATEPLQGVGRPSVTTSEKDATDFAIGPYCAEMLGCGHPETISTALFRRPSMA